MVRYLCAILVLLTAGCATKYQAASGTAYGFSEKAIADDVYRMRYVATPSSTRETVQTYWLYRATEFALEKGFDGFEIMSPIELGQSDASSPFAKVRGSFIYIPGSSHPMVLPTVEADIQLIRGPVKSHPPRVFDARQLRAALEPYVKSETKCDSGNVCPHVKRYLRPAAAIEPARPAAVESRSTAMDI